MRCLIIIPAYNESRSIEKVINDIATKCPFADYIVVNDCSTDNTREILDGIDARYISAPVNLGIGGAVQAGYKYAQANGYDMAVQVDGDGQHDVAYVRQMMDILESGSADIVIGSRFIEGEGFRSSGLRRTGIRFLDGLIHMVSGAVITDATSGFRAVNRRFIELYAEDYPDDYPEPEAIVMAALTGGRVQEIPVVMREREFGISSINLRRSVYYMIKVTIAILVRRLSYSYEKKH